MSGAKPQSFKAEKLATIPLQTSAYGLVIPIVYGTARVPGNLLWYGDFKAIKHTTQTQGGKGGGSSGSGNTSYTYTAALILGICRGPIVGVNRVWRDKDVGALTKYLQTLLVGSNTQSPWSYLSTAHPTQAIGYAGVAHAASSAADLADSAMLKNHSFEVQGPFIVGSGNLDANPADIVLDFLTNAFYGAGWPTSRVGDLVTGAASYRTYCTALGLWLSPVFDEQRPALDHLRDLLDATNSAAVWSAGVLKVVPYGDVPVTANGATFTPNTSPVYDLGPDDFLSSSPNADAITVERSAQADTFNSFPVEYSDRLQDYNTSVVEDPDPVDVETFGLRKAQVSSLHAIKTASAALQISRIKAQRSIYIRNVYTFELPWRFVLLEPMDLVTLTDPAFGLDHKVVRIRELREDEKGKLTCVAEEWPFGVATATQYTPAAGTGASPNVDVDPGNANAPVLFELPPLLTDGVPTMGIATSGGADWGGSEVWISYDGVTYSRIGTITQGARHGVTATNLLGHPASPDDPTGTLRVDLSVSGGTLVSASAQDKDDVVTACWVESTSPTTVLHEIISFQTAALVSGNTYDISVFRRGCYGTSRTAKGSPRKFVRLDEAVFTYEIPVGRIGTLVYVKLQSFNAYGGGLQDLSLVPAYTMTPQSFQLTPPLPGSCTLTITTTAPAPATGQRRHKVWEEDGGFGFTSGGDPVVKNPAFAKVAWTVNSLWPTSLLSRFRVVIYTGTDPNDESVYLHPPLDVGSAILAAVFALPTMQASTTFNAAVQSMYFGDKYESAWRTSGGSVVLDPDTFGIGRTSDYTEDGSGNPTAGAQLVPGQAVPFKIGPGGCKIGTQLMDEPVLRALNGIQRHSANGRVWYNGSNDNSVRGGAPDVARLTVTRREWATGTRALGRLELKIQPNSATDNIDSMRYAKVTWFRQSVAGTTATLTALDSTYVPLPDRIYYAPGTDADANNAIFATAVFSDAGINAGFPACKVTLYNVAGPSATHCFYAATGNADGSVLTDNGTSWPAGITGDAGGSSGGGSGPGGYCVHPDTPVVLASGLEVPARSIELGCFVLTRPEAGGPWGQFPVVSIESASAECRKLIFTDGRELIVSATHRLFAGGQWTPAQAIHTGDEIDGLDPGTVASVEALEACEVLRITVDGAHTYLTARLLSHNAKPL